MTALQIIEQELQKLHDNARDSKDSSHLLMTAHSIGVLQLIRERIKSEISYDTRIDETLP